MGVTSHAGPCAACCSLLRDGPKGARLSWVMSCSSPSGSACCYTGKNFFYGKLNSSYPERSPVWGRIHVDVNMAEESFAPKKGLAPAPLLLCCVFQSSEPPAAAGRAEPINLPEILCRRLGARDLRLHFKKMGKFVIKIHCCCREALAQLCSSVLQKQPGELTLDS